MKCRSPNMSCSVHAPSRLRDDRSRAELPISPDDARRAQSVIKALAALPPVGRPLSRPPRRLRARCLAALPTIREDAVGAVVGAVEATAAMTTHVKDLPRLFDELNSSQLTTHGASPPVWNCCPDTAPRLPRIAIIGSRRSRAIAPAMPSTRVGSMTMPGLAAPGAPISLLAGHLAERLLCDLIAPREPYFFAVPLVSTHQLPGTNSSASS